MQIQSALALPVIPGWASTSATLAFTITAALYSLYSLDTYFRHRRHGRQDGIVEISTPANPKFDIVAVHGLGAHPKFTWDWKFSKKELEDLVKSPDLSTSIKVAIEKEIHKFKTDKKKRHISLLKHILRPEFPEARILSFGYNSDWFINAPVVTPKQIADRLLGELAKFRSTNLSTPIIFIGHSFGGIVIKQALLAAKEELAAKEDIVDSTCSIVFLGTPHDGSPLSIPAAALASVSGVLGSDPTLLFALRNRSGQLSDLEKDFRTMVNDQEGRREKLTIVSFYEKMPTRAFGLFSIGVTVPASSAYGYASEIHAVDANHVDLNKSPKIYGILTKVLHSLKSPSKPIRNANQNWVTDKLNALSSAIFDCDAEPEERTRNCHPHTRVKILGRINNWANNTEGNRIFWLQGKAGTGKSTIAYTVASQIAPQSSLYGISFFFKRGAGERSNAARLFTTIACQLVEQWPGLSRHVRNAIEANPRITEKTKNEQFRKLILEPLENIEIESKNASRTIIVVIDALDECEGKKSIGEIIGLLSTAKQSCIPLKFFVTSRPEALVRNAFGAISDAYDTMALHEAPLDEIKSDMRLFLSAELERIRKELNNRPSKEGPLEKWPKPEQTEKLVEMAIPLFIFASTTCRFIEDYRYRPTKQLEKILEYNTKDHESKLDITYLPTLNQMLDGLRPREQSNHIQEFKQVVGSIVILARPLSIASLANLIEFKEQVVKDRLEMLHSVLVVPSNQHDPVEMYHLSFRDFLVDTDKGAKEFWIDETDTHEKLTGKCLTMMTGLKQDMFKQQPGTLQKNVDKQEVDTYLKPELQYACLYWVDHLQKSKYKFEDGDRVYKFLQLHLLHWLEALGWMGKVSEGINAIGLLESLVPSGIDDLSSFIHDAKRFALYNRSIIEQAPLQLYYSALIFAPEKSIVRKQFERCIPARIKKKPKGQENWSATLQTLEGHSKSVYTIAFSPDSKVLASGSDDNKVRLWDTGTGAALQTLEGHSKPVYSVAFSPDGKVLASGSGDNTVRLWDTGTGAALQTLEGHSKPVYSVAFSPDGKVLASGSEDNTVQLWDTGTGAALQTLEGHSEPVNSVAFSPDGKVLASGSEDNTVQLWDTGTGAALQTLEGHSEPVNSVAFSPDGKVLASDSSDNKVRLWDTGTGAALQTLEGHSKSVNSVAFSPDGKVLASSSSDNTVRLWDTGTGAALQTLEGHSKPVNSVAFSPDGKVLASGSSDNTVRLWDAGTGTGTGAALQRLEGHSKPVNSVAFSPDGKVLASGSWDNTVRLWDTGTGAALQTLEGHSKPVYSVAFSPDGKVLASGSWDNTVRLWDTGTGAALQTLEGYSKSINSVTFWDNVIGVSPLSFEGTLSPQATLVNVKGDWVTINGKETLWLPPEYRPETVAIYHRIIAINCQSGRIFFLQF